MAEPKDFMGSNRVLNAPPGLENIVLPLRVYGSGRESISRWKLSADELRVINETGDVWVSVQAGKSQPPIFVSGFPLMEARDSDGNLTEYTADDVEPGHVYEGVDTLQIDPAILKPKP